MAYPRVARLKTHEDFTGRLSELGIEIPCDENAPASGGCLSKSVDIDGMSIGNRFCILPMEGVTTVPGFTGAGHLYNGINGIVEVNNSGFTSW